LRGKKAHECLNGQRKHWTKLNTHVIQDKNSQKLGTGEDFLSMIKVSNKNLVAIVKGLNAFLLTQPATSQCTMKWRPDRRRKEKGSAENY
jgi:hypothetical protein